VTRDPALGLVGEAERGALAGRRAELLLQRGRDDKARAEPVVEVLAETPGLDLASQIPVGRGDELALERAVRVSPSRKMRLCRTRGSFTWTVGC
jgi:hypothetical protein